MRPQYWHLFDEPARYMDAEMRRDIPSEDVSILENWLVVAPASKLTRVVPKHELLRVILSDGQPHSNFALYRMLFGKSPCGRLASVVFDLREELQKRRVSRPEGSTFVYIDGYNDKKKMKSKRYYYRARIWRPLDRTRLVVCQGRYELFRADGTRLDKTESMETNECPTPLAASKTDDHRCSGIPQTR